uniref:Uncharacterized protein n=1 Tax=Arundo donax TaxID=35708 RepID=A0A0A8Z1T0_ARUDO
MNSQIDQVPT